MIVRAVLAAFVLLATTLQPVAQSHDERFIFRYKRSLATDAATPRPETPEVPNPGDYDVTARFFGIVGESFSSRVPTKPGARVVDWEILSGTLPQGLSFDESSGLISGIPAQATEGRRLAVHGYGPTAEMGSSADVRIDIVAPKEGSHQQEIYAHTGLPASAAIESGGATVHEWTPALPLPEWAAFLNGRITLTPPEAGVWPFAFQGRDFLGREVAFTYGHILVEDGPAVAHVNDVIQDPQVNFRVVPSTLRSIGDVFWQLEGGPLPRNLSFDYDTAEIFGSIPSFETQATFRYKATDTDGTVGYSNYFVLGTGSPGLDIADVPNLYLTVNKPFAASFSSGDVTGAPAWELVQGDLPTGMRFEGETGRLTGTPVVAGSFGSFIVEVRGTSGAVRSNPFAITVQNLPLEVSQAQSSYDVPAWSEVETLPVAVSGGVEPYSLHLAEGAELPEGFEIDGSNGVISGVAPHPGNLSVPLYASDATGTRRSDVFTVGIFAYGEPAVTVAQETYEGVRLSEFKPEIRPELSPYSLIPGVTWSIDGPELPEGLEFDNVSGRVYGTPMVHGEFGPYVFRATGGDGESAQSTETAIVIHDVPPVSIALGSTEISRLVDVNRQLAVAEHAVGEAVFTLEQGMLPDTLRFHPDGRLRGSTDLTGSLDGFQIKVRDAEGREDVSEVFSLTFVHPGEIEADDLTFVWAAGTPFSTPAVTVDNTVGAVTWSAVALPSWANAVDPATGSITGLATQPTSGDVEIRLVGTDEIGRTANVSVSVRILPALGLSLPSVMEFARLSDVSETLSASNAIGSTSFSETGFPPSVGLAFDERSGAIEGQPSAEGEWPVTFAVTDHMTGQAASASTLIRIAPRLELDIVYGDRTLSANKDKGMPIRPRTPLNAAGAVSWTLVLEDGATLPAGIEFNENTGLFTGMPVQAGIHEGIKVRGVDAEGVEDVSPPFTITVGLEGAITPATDLVRRSIRANGVLASSAPITFGNVLDPVRFVPLPGPGLGDPDGLQLVESSGSIIGSLNTVGSRTFSVRATDALDRSKTFNLVLSAVGHLSLTAHDVTVAQYQNVPADFAPVVANPIGKLAFSLSPDASTLPEGLMFLKETGRIVGSTDRIGSYGPYTLTVTDGPDEAAASFSLAVTERMPINVDYGVINLTAGSASGLPRLPLNPTYVVGTAAWEAEGQLPPGIQFDDQTGEFHGLPTEAGLFEGVTVSVSDSTGADGGPFPVTFRITPRDPVSLPQTVIRTVRVGADFETDAVEPGNAVQPLAFISREDLPAGYSLDPATGSVSGRIDAPGTVELPLRVTDVLDRGLDFSLRINAVEALSVSMPDIAVQRLRESSTQPDTRNAVGSRLYDLSEGTLPDGLEINHATGVIHGSVTDSSEVGTHGQFVMEVEDSTGDLAYSSPFHITVSERSAPALSYEVPLMSAGRPNELPVAPQVADAVEPLSWEIDGGLPPGVGFDDATGTFVGVPEIDGQWNGIAVTLTDAEGLEGQTTVSFTVLPFGIIPGQGMAVSDVTETVRSGIHFTTSGPAVANAAPPVGFAALSSVNGLSLDPATGVVSGTVSSPGEYSIDVQATDVAERSAEFSVNVTALGDLTASFQSSATNAIALSDFSYTPSAQNALGQLEWELAAGELPEGMNVNGNTGAIYGQPQDVGTWTGIRLQATDIDGATALTGPLSLTAILNGEPISLATTDLTVKAGVFFETAAPAVGNAIGDVTFTSVDAAMLGLAIDERTGVISGEFAQTGQYVIDLSVTDSTNRVTSQPVMVTAMPPLRLTVDPEITVLVNQDLAPVSVETDYAIGDVTYEIVGTLPNNLSLNGSTGVITGRSDQVVRAEGLRVRGTDSYGDTQLSNAFSIEILDDGSIPAISSMPSIPLLRTTVEMSPVTPAVQYRKHGDVFTLNQPLPDGLDLDEATGAISGIPELDAHGIYSGYVMSVRDINDRGGESQPFDVRVRHIDVPQIVVPDIHEARVGVQFTTPPLAVDNAHALVGSPSFEFNNGNLQYSNSVMTLEMDPATGAISGTLLANGTRSIAVRMRDGIGVIGEPASVSFRHVNLSVSMAAETAETGTTVSFQPTAVGAMGPDTKYSVEWQAGVVPAGLQIDAETGRIHGSMPFGSYFARITVTDNGQQAQTGWVSIRGTSNAPLAFTLTDIDDLEGGTTVETDIMPITGTGAIDRLVAGVRSLDGGLGEFRVCHDIDCEHVKQDWLADVLNNVALNGEFLQMRGSASSGSKEARRYELQVGVDRWTWTLTSEERDLPLADNMLPVTATHGISESHMTPLQLIRLYDGLDSSTATAAIDRTSMLTYDFGQVVQFDRYTLSYFRDTSYDHIVEIETDGGWVEISDRRGNANDFVVGTQYAQRVRVKGDSTTGNAVYEFRIGGGGAHPTPNLVHSNNQPIATLGNEGRTIQLAVTPESNASPYLDENPLTFTASDLPSGFTLSADGILSLPSAQSTGPGGWSFDIAAYDQFGLGNIRTVFVFAEGEPAAEVMPSAVYSGGSKLNDSPARLFTDDTQAFGIVGGEQNALMLEYEEAVTFDRVLRQYASGGTGSTMRIEAEVGDEWVRFSSSNANRTTAALSYPVTTKRVRLWFSPPNNAPFGRSISLFMPGSGDFHEFPVITGAPGLVNPLPDEPQTIQLTYTYSQAYTDEQPVLDLYSSTLPTGSSLSPDGVLTLPGKSSVGYGSWSATVRITDAFGEVGYYPIVINNPWEDASNVHPVSVSHGAVSDFYDNNLSTRHRLTAAQFGIANGIEFQFEHPVQANYVRLQHSVSTNVSYQVYGWINGGWELLRSFNMSSAPVTTTLNFWGQPAVTDRYLLVKNNSSTSVYIQSFMLGYGNVFPPYME